MLISTISPRVLLSLFFAAFSSLSDLLGLLDKADLLRCPEGAGDGFLNSKNREKK